LVHCIVANFWDRGEESNLTITIRNKYGYNFDPVILLEGRQLASEFPPGLHIRIFSPALFADAKQQKGKTT
jgi:hypothetical protein